MGTRLWYIKEPNYSFTNCRKHLKINPHHKIFNILFLILFTQTSLKWSQQIISPHLRMDSERRTFLLCRVVDTGGVMWASQPNRVRNHLVASNVTASNWANCVLWEDNGRLSVSLSRVYEHTCSNWPYTSKTNRHIAEVKLPQHVVRSGFRSWSCCLHGSSRDVKLDWSSCSHVGGGYASLIIVIFELCWIQSDW